MSDALHHFIAGDLVALLACTLAVMTCGVLGSYLVLKRESLMGDAISHAVLPGLVVAFMISHSRAPVPMFIGAGVAAGLTVLLTMLVRRFGGVEPGAAMGVVFSVMFALGVYLIESETLRDIDLDASCVLYGQVEYLVWWNAPDDPSAYLKLSTYTDTGIPSALWALAAIFVVAVAFVLVFFKELRITTFDPQMARAAGFPAWLVQGALVLLVALAVVASFQAIGSILVIAMLICPAATARMLTDRLGVQVLLAGLVAGLCAIAGYFAGAKLPTALGGEHALNIAGMITVVAGLVFAVVCFASPSHGFVARALRQRRLAERIALEDLLGLLYRSAESGEAMVPTQPIKAAGMPIARSTRLGLVREEASKLSLTEKGRRRAEGLIRRHRLWEGYLVERAGLRPDHVHATAELLEHVDQPAAIPAQSAELDPHGKAIPPAPDSGPQGG